MQISREPVCDSKENVYLPEKEILLQERPPKQISVASKPGDDAEITNAPHGQAEHPTSYAETLIHYIKANTGAGMFAMGDAIKNSGLLAGPLLIVILGTLSVFAQHQLINASAFAAKRLGLSSHPDYAETIQYSMQAGPRPLRRWASVGRKAVYFCLICTQLGFCSVYFMFVASNLKQVLDLYVTPIDVRVYMAILLVPITLECFVRSLKYLVPFSIIANICMYTGIVITLYMCTKDGLPAASERKLLVDASRLPLFFGTVIFCFEAIGMTMVLKNEMRRPEDFSRPLGVLNVGTTMIGALLITMGAVGYSKYGEDVKAVIPLNFDQTHVLSQVILLGLCIGIVLSYPIQAFVPFGLIWPHLEARLRPLKHPVAAELAFRASVVIFTWLLAELVPHLALFISLMGSVSSGLLALVFPPVMDWCYRWQEGLTPWRHAVNALILVLGVLGGVAGAYVSLIEIGQAFAKDYGWGQGGDSPASPDG